MEELPVKSLVCRHGSDTYHLGQVYFFHQSLSTTGRWVGDCDGDSPLHREMFNSIPGTHPPEAPYMPHLWDNPNISSRHGLGMQKQLLLRVTVLRIRFLNGKVEPMRVESCWWLKVKRCHVTIRCYYLQIYLFVHTLN